MDLFIPKETLDILSYKSALVKKFKADFVTGNTITQNILVDTERYHASYIDVLIQEKPLLTTINNLLKLLNTAIY